MLLSEIFTQLAYGEFRKFGIGNDDQGGILPADYPRVIPFIQLALTELHKRFQLSTQTVLIQQYGHISRYRLTEEYAQSNTTSLQPYKYIIDTEFEPFKDTMLLKVEIVYDEEGKPYPMNDPTKPLSVYTPEYNVVEIPFNHPDNAITVAYRADHPKLQVTGDNVLNQNVKISPAYLEALLLYAAGRYLMSAGSQEKEALGMGLMAKFEASVQTIKIQGLEIVDEFDNNKLELRGFA